MLFRGQNLERIEDRSFRRQNLERTEDRLACGASRRMGWKNRARGFSVI
jgi:hypothetical protein